MTGLERGPSATATIILVGLGEDKLGRRGSRNSPNGTIREGTWRKGGEGGTWGGGWGWSSGEGI